MSSHYPYIYSPQQLTTGFLDLPIFKQLIGGTVVLLSSPNVFQQKGWLSSWTGFSSMAENDIPVHGRSSLHAKCTGFDAYVPFIFM